MYKELTQIYIFVSQFDFAKNLEPQKIYELTYKLYEEKERFNGQIHIRLKSKDDRLVTK